MFQKGAEMETYLHPEKLEAPLDKLWPDPNNPRLALEDAPGYADPAKLFDEAVRQRIFDELGEAAYNIDELVAAIIAQGWMPIDNIIVWRHPTDDGKRFVIVEGNRRRLALQRIRNDVLPKERRKLERMESKASTFPKNQLEDQQRLVERLERIVADTEKLPVVRIAADSVEELERKLPRVLAVRHITGAKEWGNYAEDIWLLQRYHQLFEDKHGDAGFFWDDDVIHRVADEASLTTVKAKRQLKAASWFSHFRAEWEEELPEEEDFQSTDYYLFEQISRRPWVRQQLGVSDDASSLPDQAEATLFEWVFKLPRGRKADDNPNKFYRHENITLWDQIARYDQENSTAFALRFDVENPSAAPTMREVEAAYLTHKAQRKPHAVIDDLLQRLSELTAEQLATEGQIFRAQLERLRDEADTFLKMIDAAEAASVEAA
jgi:hypothetical protein